MVYGDLENAEVEKEELVGCNHRKVAVMVVAMEAGAAAVAAVSSAVSLVTWRGTARKAVAAEVVAVTVVAAGEAAEAVAVVTTAVRMAILLASARTPTVDLLLAVAVSDPSLLVYVYFLLI